MGRLTDDMTRLSDEIGVLHGARCAFMRHLSDTVGALRASASAMRTGFGQNLVLTARAGRLARRTFVSQLKGTVAQMQLGFQRDRARMARQTARERTAFLAAVQRTVANLKTTVTAMRREFAADILGARCAWAGGGVSGGMGSSTPDLATGFHSSDAAQFSPKKKRQRE